MPFNIYTNDRFRGAEWEKEPLTATEKWTTTGKCRPTGNNALQHYTLTIGPYTSNHEVPSMQMTCVLHPKENNFHNIEATLTSAL